MFILYNVGTFEKTAIYIDGPFAVKELGNKYQLVTMNYYSTKLTEPHAIPNEETSIVAKALIGNIFTEFMVPLELHTEQGRTFELAVFSKICELMYIKKTRTTFFHLQSDGMVVIFNRNFKGHLCEVIDKCPSAICPCF